VFKLMAAVSLAVFAAMLALWVRSHSFYDFADYTKWGRKSFSVHSGLGLVLVEVERARSKPSWVERWLGFVDDRGQGWRAGSDAVNQRGRPFWIDDTTVWGKLGLQLWYENSAGRYGWLRVSVPHWLVCVMAAVLPSMWFVRAYRAARRKGEGLCPTCGYDVRATPERCPECGNLVAAGPVQEKRARVGVIWWSAAAIGAAVVLAQSIENARAVERLADWKLTRQRVWEQENRAHEEVGDFFASRMKNGMPKRADAEDLARTGVWKSAQAAGSDPLYEDPNSHAVVRLYMLGNTWAAHGVLRRRIPEPAMPVAMARWGLVTVGYFLWWICLWRVVGTHGQKRRWAGHLMGAITMLCLVCAALPVVGPLLEG